LPYQFLNQKYCQAANLHLFLQIGEFSKSTTTTNGIVTVKLRNFMHNNIASVSLKQKKTASTLELIRNLQNLMDLSFCQNKMIYEKFEIQKLRIW